MCERFSSLTAGKVCYDSESALLSFGKHMLLVLNPASSGAIADSPKPNSSHFRISLSFSCKVESGIQSASCKTPILWLDFRKAQSFLLCTTSRLEKFDERDGAADSQLMVSAISQLGSEQLVQLRKGFEVHFATAEERAVSISTLRVTAKKGRCMVSDIGGRCSVFTCKIHRPPAQPGVR